MPAAHPINVRAIYVVAAVSPYAMAALLVAGSLLTYPSAVATLAAAAVALAAATSLRVSRRAVLLVVGAAGLVMVVASGSTLAFAVAAGLTAVAYGIGGGIVGEDAAPSRAERATYALVAGYGVLSLFALALAVLGALSVPVAAFGLIALAALTRRTLLRGARELRDLSPSALAEAPVGPLFVLVAICVLAVLAHVVAPEVQSDALNYHLGLNREYLDAGALVDRPEQPQSYYYRAADMDFLLAMLLGGQIAARALSAAAVGLGVVALWSFGSDVFSPRAARLGAILFLFTPVVLWGATTTYVDGIVSAFAFIAVAAMYRAATEPSARRLAVAGLLVAVTVTTKLTVLLVIVPAVAWLAWTILRAPRSRSRVRDLALFAGAALVAAAPWPLLIFARTGNPVFPFLNAIFRSPLWPTVNESFDLARYGLHGWQTVFAPLLITYDGSRFSDEFVGPVMGIAILLAPLAPRSRARSILLLAGLGGCVLWLVTFQYLRYLVPVVPILSLLAGAALERVMTGSAGAVRTLMRATPTVVVVASLVLFLGTFRSWPVDAVVPYTVAFGVEPAPDYLRSLLPTYEPLRSVAATAGASSRVLIASCQSENDEQDRLYAPGRIESCESPWARELYRLRSDDAVVAALRDRGITHVLLLAHSARGDLVDSPVLRQSFLDAHGHLEYERGPVRLYRLTL